MNERIKDKIKDIEIFLDELESVLPSSFEEYANDFKIKAIGERYFEKIIESVIDLAFFVIKDKHFKTPEEDKQAFDILYENEIISYELSEKLKEAKGMRNIIAHEYGKIDDELVFNSLTEELIKDASEFSDIIKKLK